MYNIDDWKWTQCADYDGEGVKFETTNLVYLTYYDWLRNIKVPDGTIIEYNCEKWKFKANTNDEDNAGTILWSPYGCWYRQYEERIL